MSSQLSGDVFLVMTGRTNRLHVVRHSAKMPTLGPTERAVRLRLTVPAALFANPPVPTVEVLLDPDRIAIGRATVEVLEPVEVLP